MYLSYWMRQSGLTDIFLSLRHEAVYVGVSAGSMAASSTFGDTFRNPPGGSGNVLTSEDIVSATPTGEINRNFVTTQGAGGNLVYSSPMYYIVFCFFYLLSLLPMRMLYIISDGIYLVVYYVIGYRKKVVMKNLEIAFPEKSNVERVIIAKAFYHNLLDSFIETLKLLSASRRFLEKRITGNWEVLGPLYKSGKSCQLHLGHTFNWEWGHHVLRSYTKYQVLVVYMPLTNAVFEKLMYKLRVRHGNQFIAAGNMSKSMETFKDTHYLLGLVADQSPGNLNTAYWMNFFGKPTGFVSGPEKGARAGNLPVLFASIVKPKRGYYHAFLEVACEDPSTMKEGELTLRYARYMEKVIRANPEMWLWSHRRWKHSWDPAYSRNWMGENLPG